MKVVLAMILVGAASAAPAFVFWKPDCAERFRRARVTVDLKNSTLREFLKTLELQSDCPISRTCACGALDRVIDEPGFTLRVTDISMASALLLGSSSKLYAHCGGGWGVEGERVVLHCGLRRRE